jgi:hypothetical protein
MVQFNKGKRLQDPLRDCIRWNNEVEFKLPHHLDQMLHTTSHCKEIWRDDSSTPSHKTQQIETSGAKTLHLERFILVGIQSRRSFQEKATTFDGARIFPR